MSSRVSFLRLAQRSIFLWVGLLLLLAGTVFSVTGIQQAQQEQQYRQHGLTVEATVVNKSLVPAKRGEQSRTRYLLEYRFTTRQGEAKDGTTELSVEEWEQTKTGHRVPVRYLPDAPHISRAAGDDEWATALLLSGLGLTLALVGGGLTWSQLRSLLRTLRLTRDGVPTEGTIITVGPTRTRINRVTQWQIQYRYQDHLGRTHEGRSYLLSPTEAAEWQKGATGTVRFDRQRPEMSAWIGKMS
jgi:hypothetical protein